MDQKPSEIRVVGARADKKMAVLYLESGEELIIKQGDHRLGDLMDKIIPITTRGEVAVVSLEDFSIYAAFEQKSQGMTKFFKMAKDKVKGWFGGKTDTHETHIPEEGKEAIIRAVMGESMTEAEVMEHGQPVNVNDEVDETKEVVVAVVTTPATATEPEKKAVIPGVNKIKPLIEHAVKSNSEQAVQNFLTRCAAFIDKRHHTVDDLMRFLEKGDLPLAEDGSIIAYKRLRSTGTDGVFVDCHSGKIKQRVGSYVCVNEDLVDLNRRNECSNGLHIGRRSYMGSFTGDVWVLCKIDPEDVMVVPHNDANKVRVKGYHILAKLGPEAIDALRQNKPMTGDEGALAIVYQAIKGNHIDRIERVQVNGQMGSNVVITPLKHDKTKGKAGYDYDASDLKKAAALDDEVHTVGSVDPREINKKVSEELAKVQEEQQTGTVQAPEIIGNNSEKVIVDEIAHKELADKTMPKLSAMAELLLEYQTAPTSDSVRSAAQTIMAFKKSKKKGWDKLGIDDNLATQIIRDADASKVPDPNPAPVKAGTKEKKVTEVINPPSKEGEKIIKRALKEAPKKKAKPVKEEPVIPSSGSLTTADRAREMFNRGLFKDVKNLSKSKKKSLKALHFTDAEIKKIEENL